MLISNHYMQLCLKCIVEWMSSSPSEGRGAWPVVFERPAQTHSEDGPDEADAPTSPHPAFCNHDNTHASHTDNTCFTEIKGAVSVSSKNFHQTQTEPRSAAEICVILQDNTDHSHSDGFER